MILAGPRLKWAIPVHTKHERKERTPYVPRVVRIDFIRHGTGAEDSSFAAPIRRHRLFLAAPMAYRRPDGGNADRLLGLEIRLVGDSTPVDFRVWRLGQRVFMDVG
ncbi:hypothetical protein A7Q10_10550 [Methylacidiphilum caldifontis]|uniref:Uncharacterized protein n=1 Tax=Methylacidiphilum caldifontis TaxID=2795386 RepID=A0A4Y8PJQ3_9BACT|nr:hypothetical protein A7Q10_10550 [Methylacidiphilum caldifontis]